MLNEFVKINHNFYLNIYHITTLLIYVSLDTMFFLGLLNTINGNFETVELLIFLLIVRLIMSVLMHKLILRYAEIKDACARINEVNRYVESNDFEISKEQEAFIRINSEVYINNILLPSLRIPVETISILVIGSFILFEDPIMAPILFAFCVLIMVLYIFILVPKQKQNAIASEQTSVSYQNSVSNYLIEKDMFRFAEVSLQRRSIVILQNSLEQFLRNIHKARFLQLLPKISIECVMYSIILATLFLYSGSDDNKYNNGVLLLILRALPVINLYLVAYSQLVFAQPYVKFFRR